MKKILFLLLLPFLAISQTQTFNTPPIIKGVQKVNSNTKVLSLNPTTNKIEYVDKLTIVDTSAVHKTGTSLQFIKGDGSLDSTTYASTKALVDGLETKINTSEKGTANGVATLGTDGKVPNSQIPALAISETFPVTSQVEMLALNAQQGDVAIRSDISKSYILRQEPASTLGNWSELLSPTDAVTSVAGKVGVVTLTKSDVGLENVDNTSDLNKPISTATQAALNLKANLSGGNSFTGTQNITTNILNGTGANITTTSNSSAGINISTTGAYSHGFVASATGTQAIGLSLNVSNNGGNLIEAKQSNVNKFVVTKDGNIAGGTYNGYVPASTTALATKADQNGTILYHSAKWFTPTSTVSSSGTTVTSIGTQFTSAMIGAKLIISGEERIITTYTSSTVVVVASAYSTNYSGVAAGSWGVYSKQYEIKSDGIAYLYSTDGNNRTSFLADATVSYSGLYHKFGRGALIDGVLAGHSGFLVQWSNGSNYAATKDLGLSRNAAGVLEVNDGTAGNFRDLKLQKLESTQTTGTAPLVVASTTKVGNLNADLLDGYDVTVLPVSTPVQTAIDNADSSNIKTTGDQLKTGSLTLKSIAADTEKVFKTTTLLGGEGSSITAAGNATFNSITTGNFTVNYLYPVNVQFLSDNGIHWDGGPTKYLKSNRAKLYTDMPMEAPKFITPTGTNASAGNATLVGGTVTVTTTAATTDSLIQLTIKTAGGTVGSYLTYTTTGGSFTITSQNPLDTSTVTYLIIN